MAFTDLPINYRSKEVSRIMGAIRAGESCAVVGVNGCGKSNLMRFLAERRVQAHYLGPDREPRLFVLAEGDDLTECSEDAVYELLLSRLERATAEQRPAGGPTFDLTLIEKVHELRQGSGPPGAIRRLFGQAVAGLQASGRRLAFLLDNFDEAFRQCSPAVFAGLRALRNEHKYRLVYVVAGRAPLPSQRDYSPKFQTFYELFEQNTVWLEPYNHDDALYEVRRLAERAGVSLLTDEAERLVRASGGHPGLLKKAFHAARDRHALPWPAFMQHLCADRNVRSQRSNRSVSLPAPTRVRVS